MVCRFLIAGASLASEQGPWGMWASVAARHGVGVPIPTHSVVGVPGLNNFIYGLSCSKACGIFFD